MISRVNQCDCKEEIT